jgi:hypothetical protein
MSAYHQNVSEKFFAKLPAHKANTVDTNACWHALLINPIILNSLLVIEKESPAYKTYSRRLQLIYIIAQPIKLLHFALQTE